MVGLCQGYSLEESHRRTGLFTMGVGKTGAATWKGVEAEIGGEGQKKRGREEKRREKDRLSRTHGLREGE